MFYALILSSKGKTDHSKNIPLAKNTHSDANSVWLYQNNTPTWRIHDSTRLFIKSNDDLMGTKYPTID